MEHDEVVYNPTWSEVNWYLKAYFQEPVNVLKLILTAEQKENSGMGAVQVQHCSVGIQT